MNPLVTDGFEFIEFTSPDPNALAQRFSLMGFTAIGRHRSKNVFRYRQGDINFLLNMEPTGQAAEFRGLHGASANAMAFRVRDASAAFALAIKRGAVAVAGPLGPMELNIPAIEGIGGSNLYLVDRYGAQEIYDVDFVPIEGASEQAAENSVGLTSLDHLTHSLFRGNLRKWADFYERIFNFREIGVSHSEGEQSTVISRSMLSPCGKIRISLNQSRNERGRVEEFLASYNGEGIQDLALSTGDILASVDRMRARGVAFQDTPDDYYDTLTWCGTGDSANSDHLRRSRVRVESASADGRRVLQISTASVTGSMVFGIIQRNENRGLHDDGSRVVSEIPNPGQAGFGKARAS